MKFPQSHKFHQECENSVLHSAPPPKQHHRTFEDVMIGRTIPKYLPMCQNLINFQNSQVISSMTGSFDQNSSHSPQSLSLSFLARSPNEPQHTCSCIAPIIGTVPPGLPIFAKFY